jgi:23S rRNA pseudouridine2604 synthase
MSVGFLASVFSPRRGVPRWRRPARAAQLLQGALAPEGLARLRYGLTLDNVKLKPAQVAWQNEDQLRFGLREGRKRQIRRMCEIVGLKVTGLKRIRTGRVLLGALPVGQWRYLGVDEGF